MLFNGKRILITHLRWGEWNKLKCFLEHPKMLNLLCYNDLGFAFISLTRRRPKWDNQSIAHTRWNCTYQILFSEVSL